MHKQVILLLTGRRMLFPVIGETVLLPILSHPFDCFVLGSIQASPVPRALSFFLSNMLPLG